MKNIVVFGSSGHAKVIIDILEKQARYHIVGLIDPLVSVGKTIYGYSVIGSEEDLNEIIKKFNVYGGIVAIGDNILRNIVVRKIQEQIDFLPFVTAIHPSAQIAKGVVVGCGTAVMAGVVINSDSTIGCHCVINTSASIDHENMFGDFVSAAPITATGGNVSIGDFSFLGIGSVVKHGVSVGRHTVIGAGSLVLDDIPDSVIAYGHPASVVRKRNPEERYL